MDPQPTVSKTYHPTIWTGRRKRQLEDPLWHKPGRAIFMAIGRYGYLSHRQILRLLFAETSGSMVYEWLKVLRAKGLIHSRNYLHTSFDGPAMRVHTFTQAGRTQLVDLGLTDLPKNHHGRILRESTLDHTLAVNDALIAGELLSRKVPGIELLGLKTDEQTHMRQTKVPLPDGRQIELVPDGWEHLAIGADQVAWCLEVDRATETDARKWKNKIRGYISFASGNPSPYERAFFGDERPFSEGEERRPIRVLVMVNPKNFHEAPTPQHRLNILKAWTEQELADLGKRNWASLFAFTPLSPVDTDPREFFGSPVWEAPFQQEKVPIVEGIA
jgi:DNA-binding PadR family transcriptional regulator